MQSNITTERIFCQDFDKKFAPKTLKTKTPYNDDSSQLSTISHWDKAFCMFGRIKRKNQFDTTGIPYHLPFNYKNEQLFVGTSSEHLLRGSLQDVYSKYLQATGAEYLGVMATLTNPYVILRANNRVVGKNFTPEMADNMGLCYYEDNYGDVVAVGKVNRSLKKWRTQYNADSLPFKFYMHGAAPLMGDGIFFADRYMDDDKAIEITQRTVEYRWQLRKLPVHRKPSKQMLSYVSTYVNQNWEWLQKNRPHLFGRKVDMWGLMFQAYDRGLQLSETKNDWKLLSAMVWCAGLKAKKINRKRLSDEKMGKLVQKIVLSYVDFRTATDPIEKMLEYGLIIPSCKLHPIKSVVPEINRLANSFKELERFGHTYLSENRQIHYKTNVVTMGFNELADEWNLRISNKSRLKTVNLVFDYDTINWFLRTQKIGENF